MLETVFKLVERLDWYEPEYIKIHYLIFSYDEKEKRMCMTFKIQWVHEDNTRTALKMEYRIDDYTDLDCIFGWLNKESEKFGRDPNKYMRSDRFSFIEEWGENVNTWFANESCDDDISLIDLADSDTLTLTVDDGKINFDKESINSHLRVNPHDMKYQIKKKLASKIGVGLGYLDVDFDESDKAAICMEDSKNMELIRISEELSKKIVVDYSRTLLASTFHHVIVHMDKNLCVADYEISLNH